MPPPLFEVGTTSSSVHDEIAIDEATENKRM